MTMAVALTRSSLRDTPEGVFREATGLDLVEFVGLGFALYAQRHMDPRG